MKERRGEQYEDRSVQRAAPAISDAPCEVDQDRTGPQREHVAQRDHPARLDAHQPFPAPRNVLGERGQDGQQSACRGAGCRGFPPRAGARSAPFHIATVRLGDKATITRF
jgi:hypothetical protein